MWQVLRIWMESAATISVHGVVYNEGNNLLINTNQRQTHSIPVGTNLKHILYISLLLHVSYLCVCVCACGEGSMTQFQGHAQASGSFPACLSVTLISLMVVMCGSRCCKDFSLNDTQVLHLCVSRKEPSESIDPLFFLNRALFFGKPFFPTLHHMKDYPFKVASAHGVFFSQSHIEIHFCIKPSVHSE